MNIIPNPNTEMLKTMLADPVKLAEQVIGWREHMGLSQREAAYFFDIPVRTLQGIEQGRGFRYPVLLWSTMSRLDTDLQQFKAMTPGQRIATLKQAEKGRARVVAGL